VCGPDLTADVDAGAIGESPVENCDVRTQGGDATRGFLSETRLADHDDVTVGLQQVLEPAPDHFVVIKQEDPDGPVDAGRVGHASHRHTVVRATGASRRAGHCIGRSGRTMANSSRPVI
jgi:hypothetical protein